jgi:hypothetical protein
MENGAGARKELDWNEGLKDEVRRGKGREEEISE